MTTLMPPWDTALVRQQAGPPTHGPTGQRWTGSWTSTGGSSPAAAWSRSARTSHSSRSGCTCTSPSARCTGPACHRRRLCAPPPCCPPRVFGADADLGTLEEGKLADLTIVDGDPFTDFDTLIRTESVLRGGVPYAQADLVDAFTSATTRGHAPQRSASPVDWLEVSRQMRREGCCSPESGG